MTVATEKTDAFLRYIRSAEVNKLPGKVIVSNLWEANIFKIIIIIMHKIKRYAIPSCCI